MVAATPIETVNIQVTARCNIDCACCFQPKHREEMSAETIGALIEEIAALGARLVMFSGGEPTLRPELADWIRLAAGLGLETRVATNATTGSLAQACRYRNAGLRWLHLSLNVEEPGHSADKDPRAWERAERALRTYVVGGLDVVANLIVTARNLDFIEENVARLEGLGIRGVNLLRPKPSLDASWFEDRRLGPEEIYRVQRLKMRLHRRFQLDEILLDCSLGSLIYAVPGPLARRAGMRGCVAGLSFANVDACGDVYACPDLKRVDLRAGNLRDASFAEIWRTAPIFSRLRDRQLQGSCGGCHAAQSCGGCRAMALHDSGDLFGPDEDCPWGSAGPIQKAGRLVPMMADFLGAFTSEVARELCKA